MLRSDLGTYLTLPEFNPRPGASGFQVSNPSALDLAAVVASLQIFNETSMAALRERSVRLTRFLELLLWQLQRENPDQFTIITPEDPAQRGAQLSVKLKSVMLDPLLEVLEDKGVVIDERKPDVVRVAPAPLFNTFNDGKWQPASDLLLSATELSAMQVQSLTDCMCSLELLPNLQRSLLESRREA